jgi:hypothetical protein
MKRQNPAVSAAPAIRRVKGSSDRFVLPGALAAPRLPTGAMTAFLGRLLMRGQFVSGSPPWTHVGTNSRVTLVFGYAQRLLARLVDQHGPTILENVRGAAKPKLTKSAVRLVSGARRNQ